MAASSAAGVALDPTVSPVRGRRVLWPVTWLVSARARPSGAAERAPGVAAADPVQRSVRRARGAETQCKPNRDGADALGSSVVARRRWHSGVRTWEGPRCATLDETPPSPDSAMQSQVRWGSGSHPFGRPPWGGFDQRMNSQGGGAP